MRRPALRGFSLIEIMIALALGVIIMLGVTQIATDNSVIRYELDRSGRQIENAAYALREIESDLMSSGFWGEMGVQTNGDVLPDTFSMCPAEACLLEDFADLDDDTCQLNRAMRVPVQGISEVFDCPTIDGSDGDTITPKAGSDALAARRASSCALGSAGCDDANDNFHLQGIACFDPSDDDAPLPGIDYVIAEIADDPDFSVFVYEQRDCDDTAGLAERAPIYRFLNRVYYVNDMDELIRAELVGDEYDQTILVEGIEMLRFEYGLDRDGDGLVDDCPGFRLEPTTDYCTDPSTPAADAFPEGWADVVAVRAYMVVRNLEASPGFTDDKQYRVAGENYVVPAAFDNHRRQVYVRTVGLRNVAGRRQ